MRHAAFLWKTLILVIALSVLTGTGYAGPSVVKNGRFTNVYVYPDPGRETWEQHMARLRPADAARFSRASIDRFTARLMSPGWPSYFDALYQYSGIHPPRFFGSAVASNACVQAALRDEHRGVLQWDTIRTLSNCHIAGHDPSPQVILIFSPDIKIAKILPVNRTGPDMCTGSTKAWHAWGLNTPNFVAMPTSRLCTPNFSNFTQTLSHEIVETVSDPAGAGMGTLGQHELGDNCENRTPPELTLYRGYSVERYWSNFDRNCQPRLDAPSGSVTTTWVLGERSPLQRFTGQVHQLTLHVPAARAVTDARATEVQLVIQTGGDDLRAGRNAGDNANATLTFVGGSRTTYDINRRRSWENGETHAVRLMLPSPAPRVSDITGVTISTRFGGGIGGDNWNVDKVALVVSYPALSRVRRPLPVIVHTWLDASGAPLVRFTGHVHDRVLNVPRRDVGRRVRSLDLIISTGNDDLRGGSHVRDDCNVYVVLTSGATILIRNVNGGHTWHNWSDHVVHIPLPAAGLQGGQIRSIRLHTGFGGGIGGDNWNVNRVQLRATLQ